MYEYVARITAVVDGDTFDADVDLGFRIRVAMRFRLYGIDTPERGDPLWARARDEALRLMPVGSEVRIVTLKDRAEKFGRYLAVVSLPETDADVARELMSLGVARPYNGQGPHPWPKPTPARRPNTPRDIG